VAANWLPVGDLSRPYLPHREGGGVASEAGAQAAPPATVVPAVVP
jgi:hypothetical protein